MYPQFPLSVAEEHPVAGSVEPRVAERRVVEPYWAELSALVTRAEGIRATMSRLHAERAEICAAAVELVADRVRQRAAVRGRADAREFGDEIPLREVIAELGAALRVSDPTLRSWLGDGSALVRDYPLALEALRSGRIDERHASAIVDAGAGLDDEIRTEYEARVLGVAGEMTAPGLREAARVIAARLQPGLAEQRQKAAHERRRVRAYSLEDGVVRLQADGPAARVLAMFDRLTRLAETLEADPADDAVGVSDTESGRHDDALACGDRDGAAGGGEEPVDVDGVDSLAGRAAPVDGRCRDQLRFDILAELLLAGSPASGSGTDALAEVRGAVQVTIPVLTLAGFDDEPAVLAGHGPIDADTARRIAGGAGGWDRILTHPITGIPLAVDRYRPTAQQRRYLIARDRHCRWVGCRHPAPRCDADHTLAHADGGPTTIENLSLLCRRHHTLKHASRWRVSHLGAGILEFESPTGRTYRNNAPPAIGFLPPRWQTPYNAQDPAPF